MFKNLVKTGLLTMALALGACSSNSGGNSGTGGASGTGGTTGSGGMTATGGASGTGGMTGTGGMISDGGTDSDAISGTGGMSGSGGAGGAMTISDCGKLATPQAINNCIINLPTTSVGQTVTTPTTPTFNSCKM